MEACLILGELKMGTDALLAAILSAVLRPSAQPMEFGRAAVTADDIEQVRSLIHYLARLLYLGIYMYRNASPFFIYLCS